MVEISQIPLVKDTRRNRVMASIVFTMLLGFFAFAAHVLHELDQSSQRTELQISRFLEWRANSEERYRDIEKRIDDLQMMVLEKALDANQSMNIERR